MKTVCETVKWYEALGRDKEPELGEIRHMGVVDKDNVHMDRSLCRVAAINLCCRLLEDDIVATGQGARKRMRY